MQTEADLDPRWSRAVDLLLEGLPKIQIARLCGVSRNTITAWTQHADVLANPTPARIASQRASRGPPRVRLVRTAIRRKSAEDRGVITLVPYRSFEVACPVCRVALRAELARLYCDACGGMMIEVDDLVTTIEQLVQIEPEVQFVTGVVGTRPCPRCASPMVMCHLRVAWSDDLRPESYWQSDSSWHYERLARGRTLRSELDRCVAHGVWFDRDELPEIIDRLRVATRSAGVSTRA